MLISCSRALAAIDELVKDKDLVMLVVSVSPIAPSGPQAFYGVRPSNNNKNNNNNNRGNRNNSRGNNNNRGRGNGRQFDWASTQNTMYDTCNRCDTGANSYVTPDLEAMDNSEAYYGHNALHIGNEWHQAKKQEYDTLMKNGTWSLVPRPSKDLLDLGFKGSKTDPSLFIYSRGDTLLYILVYVDDIIVTGVILAKETWRKSKGSRDGLRSLLQIKGVD
nr:hypothetical protein [Tanacetum cinerariifolium]